MLQRSFSERRHGVKAFGVKVLPSTFQMPPLRVTGVDIKNPLQEDSIGNEISNCLPSNYYSQSNGGKANTPQGNGTCGKPSDRARYINSHSFDDLDLEELTESERDLKIDYELGRAENNIKLAYEVAQAERLAEQEVMGLDDILKMCTDYEQQLQREQQFSQSISERKNASRLCSMTKIKTNGSLTSPIHIRRFAELSKERHSNGHTLPRSDCNFDADQSLSHRCSAEVPPDADLDWTNGVEQLSSTSSSEFLDRSPTIRSQSVYENDEVFAAFQTDSSDCFNSSDDALDCSPLNFPVQQTSRSAHLTPGYTEGASRQLLLTERNVSGEKPQGNSHSKRNSGDQRLNLELTKLKRMKVESAERIGRTKNRITEIDELQEKVIHELEHELELVLKDSTEVLASLKLEEERMAVIREQQMELLMQAAKEREDFQQQIEAERRKMEELEAVHRESSRRLDCPASSGILPQLLQTAKKDKDAVEAQRRTFDDLEFSLLELETRHEEEREPMQRKLAAELDSLLQLKSQREETICLIEKQKLDVLHEANTEITNLEKERNVLMRAFKKERLVYLAIAEQLNQLAVHLPISNDDFPYVTGNDLSEEDGCGWESRPPNHLPAASAVADDLCKTPPMKVRVRQTLVNLEQEHLTTSSVQHQRGSRMVGVSSRGLDSQSSQEINGDVSPTSKIFSSGSEDSSFNSFEGVAKEDANRTEIGSKSEDPLPLASKKEKLFEPGNTQGGSRALGRSLSEPRKTGRLELNSTDVRVVSMTDDEIKLRENHKTQARPLTRYLPVRDKTLDLRCFVESSGHSLDDTSQVLVSMSTCCGYLKKQGGKFRTWHKRWFVFDRNRRCLTYYVDRTETKLRRSIYFQSIMDVFVDHLRTVVSPNQKLTFCLKTLDRRYYLLAPTAEAMRIWIDVLFTGAEGYQEFC